MLEEMAVQQHLRWYTVYLWAAGAACAVEIPWSCPQACHCNRELKEVNCSVHQLTTVPAELPQDATLLNLTHNNIKTLVREHFKTLTQLQDLDVSNNILLMIEVEAFIGLQSLLTLRLAHNRLKILPVGAFIGLPKLLLLDISYNEILVFLDFTFRDLVALQHIEAGENDIVFISKQAFTGLSSLQHLHLNGCNLTAVPTEALTQLSSLTTFYFGGTGLTTLPNNSFRHLGRLRELVISHCPVLETLAVNSFFGLNITSLTISNCNLSTMPYAPLHHLVFLVYLDLSFNPIAYLQGNLLRDLIQLQEFHLVRGGLLQIEIGAFRGLTQLKMVNVSENLLTTLEEGAFHSAGSLKILRIDNNPLACDCRLLWIARRKPSPDFGGHPPQCTSADHLKRWDFQKFSEVEIPGLFTCRRSRISNRKPQHVRVDEGHRVFFHCKADGEPAPLISWLNPHLIPVARNGRIRALSNGSLEIQYAQAKDSGTYVCVASNAAGNDSITVSLHVRGYSRLSQKPFKLETWLPFPSGSPPVNGTQQIQLDVKTLMIAITIGFLSFLSSVTICFIFMFLWSKSKGQLKRTATVAYVPRSAGKTSNGGRGNYMEPGRLTMKLI